MEVYHNGFVGMQQIRFMCISFETRTHCNGKQNQYVMIRVHSIVCPALSSKCCKINALAYNCSNTFCSCPGLMESRPGSLQTRGQTERRSYRDRIFQLRRMANRIPVGGGDLAFCKRLSVFRARGFQHGGCVLTEDE